MVDATPVRGTIRPLVWDRGSAVTSFGRYTVVEEDWDNDPFWFVLIDGRSLGRLGEHESEDSAKAAAQADYEARILAAIEPTPAEAPAGCEYCIDVLQADGETPCPCQRTEVSVAEAVRPPKVAVDALANYQQADADGCMVLVSRQAIEECLPALRALTEAGS